MDILSMAVGAYVLGSVHGCALEEITSNIAVDTYEELKRTPQAIVAYHLPEIREDSDMPYVALFFDGGNKEFHVLAVDTGEYAGIDRLEIFRNDELYKTIEHRGFPGSYLIFNAKTEEATLDVEHTYTVTAVDVDGNSSVSNMVELPRSPVFY